VEIVNDNVEVSGRESIFEFNLGCVQSFGETFFSFCVSFSQALFQLFDRWWLDEDENWVEMGISDLFYAFDFNVKDTNFSVFLNVFDGFFAKKRIELKIF
jgi:hypothetical protein